MPISILGSDVSLPERNSINVQFKRIKTALMLSELLTKYIYNTCVVTREIKFYFYVAPIAPFKGYITKLKTQFYNINNK